MSNVDYTPSLTSKKRSRDVMLAFRFGTSIASGSIDGVLITRSGLLSGKRLVPPRVLHYHEPQKGNKKMSKEKRRYECLIHRLRSENLINLKSVNEKSLARLLSGNLFWKKFFQEITMRIIEIRRSITKNNSDVLINCWEFIDIAVAVYRL
ncbi:hypothetical protein HZH68_012512 [Vespula germanica]|uniref:Uncharacterized protein n=1 Tax=Vespula germanica TaxID=30212 RepID=A0A834JIA4_VESGE|nr:hypothetical protein HZH68_012512 [Vespula germanica]